MLDEIEELIEDTPGVARVQELELHFAAPNAGVRCLTPDPHQPHTWYGGSDGSLWRSLNDGRG
jgi:hypothetical protein